MITPIIFFVGVILYVLKKHNSNRLEHHLVLLNEYKWCTWVYSNFCFYWIALFKLIWRMVILVVFFWKYYFIVSNFKYFKRWFSAIFLIWFFNLFFEIYDLSFHLDNCWFIYQTDLYSVFFFFNLYMLFSYLIYWVHLVLGNG